MGRTELLEAGRSVVTVIDLQGKLMEMACRKNLVIAATIRLMKIADIFGVPVVLTEQYPQGLGATHPDVRSVYDELGTAKRFMEKVSFGCCGEASFGTALDDLLQNVPAERRQIVVAGIEAHVCVMQTVVELLRDDSQVHLCWECVSGRGEEYRDNALRRMEQAGAVLTNHESVGFEWARDKDHEGFKPLNRLLREGQLT